MRQTLEVSRILPARPGLLPRRIVLVELHNEPEWKGGAKWVTWQQALQPSGEWSSFWGHYFHDDDGGLKAARSDYDDRVRRLTLKKTELNQLMYEHSATHCGVTHGPWPGRAPDSMYICNRCRKEMKVEERQVMDKPAAELILRNRGRLDEACACGAILGHHVVYHENDKAYFLHCCVCGEEICELNKEDVL